MAKLAVVGLALLEAEIDEAIESPNAGEIALNLIILEPAKPTNPKA